MRQVVLVTVIALAGLGLGSQASSAAPRHDAEAYAQNARAECILPWYRFVGMCDEAIDDTINQNSSRNWQHGRFHHHGHHR